MLSIHAEAGSIGNSESIADVTLSSPTHTYLLLGVLAFRLEGGREDDLCEAELCLFGLCWVHFSGERPVLTEGSVCRGVTNSASDKRTQK